MPNNISRKVAIALHETHILDELLLNHFTMVEISY